MRILLSTIGSRGDVQPLVALAMQLRALGQDVRLCVPPDFRDWIEGLGLDVVPIGPEVRATAAPAPATAATAATAATQAPPTPPSQEHIRRMIEGTVATQFETIATAAERCDIIVGATAPRLAARSVAEKMGIPYVFTVYCPAVVPSRHHAPPPLRMLAQAPAMTTAADNRELWDQDARRWNDMWGPALNTHRAAMGLPAIDDVRGHIFTDRPWLAADSVLGPWPALELDAADADQDRDQAAAVLQTGAWILEDDRPLSRELEAFLDAGEPPIYFGFGSMRAPQDLGAVMVQTARALGRRAIVSRGWANLSLDGSYAQDCLTIDEINQQALFPRVAAVVHHGGAGTTTAAARAGAPQVIIPQLYDQHYWAARINHLGLGSAHVAGAPTIDSLTSALYRALHPPVAARAREIAATIRTDGALVAAQHVMAI